LENDKSLKNAKLHGSPELKRLLFGHEKALKQVKKEVLLCVIGKFLITLK
jgi:hypothetical protein